MKILVADDEKNMREALRKYLELEGFSVQCAENGLSARRALEREAFAAGVLDLKMPGLDGLELLQWIMQAGPRVPVIMISAHGEIEDAVQAMKLGARDYIVKPFDPEELAMRLKRILEEERIRTEVEAGKHAGISDPGLVGKSSVMLDIRQIAAKIARSPSTVLITGDSGTGKEVVARSIHAMSAMSDGAFVAVNIGGIPDALLESELFGHERGAFTGATARKIGMFELAARGTLFLDEIGDMPPNLQVKLLRVIQEKKIQRLGGTQQLPVEARIISATNKNLKRLVEDGGFREDLYYRLDVVHIHVPPLRERLEDLPELVGYLIQKMNGKIGRKMKSMTTDALEHLGRYSFPGNIRELENLIERAFIFAESDSITLRDLDIPLSHSAGPGKPLTLKSVERETILDALGRWEGNRTRASAELGITRRTLFNKMREYRIE